MVGYLGLNYLEMVKEKKDSFLHKAVLTLPGQVKSLLKDWEIVDDKIRWPWRGAFVDKKIFQEECPQSYAVGGDVGFPSGLELYGCEFDQDWYGDFELGDMYETMEDKDFITPVVQPHIFPADRKLEDVTVELYDTELNGTAYHPDLSAQVRCLTPLFIKDPFIKCYSDRQDLHIPAERSERFLIKEEFKSEQGSIKKQDKLEEIILPDTNLTHQDYLPKQHLHLFDMGDVGDTEFILKTQKNSHTEYYDGMQNCLKSSIKNRTFSEDFSAAESREIKEIESPILLNEFPVQELRIKNLLPLHLDMQLKILPKCNTLTHHLLPSDVNFDPCCAEICRFQEPDLSPVQFEIPRNIKHLIDDILMGQKWTTWNVELNLPWNLSVISLQNVDICEDVLRYMHNSQREKHEWTADVEHFYTEDIEFHRTKKPREMEGFDEMVVKQLSVINKNSITATEDFLHTGGIINIHCQQDSVFSGKLALKNHAESESDFFHKDKSMSVDSKEKMQYTGSKSCLPDITEGAKSRDNTQSDDNRERTPIHSSYLTNIHHSHEHDILESENISKTKDRKEMQRQTLNNDSGKLLKKSNQLVCLCNDDGCTKLSGILTQTECGRNQECCSYTNNGTWNKDVAYNCITGSKNTATASKQQMDNFVRQNNVLDTFDSQLKCVENCRMYEIPVKDMDKCQGNDENQFSDTFPVPKLPQRKKRAKSKNISFCFKDEYLEVLKLLDYHACYFISSLRQTGDLTQSQTFATLTPSKTRFIMKEIENQQKEKKDVGQYRAAVALHSVCCAEEMIQHACLESCIELLSVIHEKFGECLKGCLQDIRQKLFYAKVHFDKQNILHPRIQLLCYYVHRKLHSKNPSKVSHHKVLIILNRNMKSLIDTILDSLNIQTSFGIHLQETGQCNDIIISLDSCECMVIHSSLVQDDFPWSQFSLVIQYEGSEFLSLCQRQSIKYIHFTYSQQIIRDSDLKNEVNINIICSSDVSSGLRHRLESKYSITVLERACDRLLPDILMDERSCIVLYEQDHLREDFNFDSFLLHISKLALKFCRIFIILSAHPCSWRKGGYILQKLNIALDCLACLFTDLEFKVLVSCSEDETAEIIYEACKTTTSFTEEQDSLSEELSKEEKFLTSFPCINSILAQKMLQILSLRSILSLNAEQLSRLFPTMPKYCFKMFEQIINTGESIKDSSVERTGQNEGEIPEADSDPCDRFGSDEQSQIELDLTLLNDSLQESCNGKPSPLLIEDSLLQLPNSPILNYKDQSSQIKYPESEIQNNQRQPYDGKTREKTHIPLLLMDGKDLLKRATQQKLKFDELSDEDEDEEILSQESTKSYIPSKFTRAQTPSTDQPLKSSCLKEIRKIVNKHAISQSHTTTHMIGSSYSRNTGSLKGNSTPSVTRDLASFMNSPYNAQHKIIKGATAYRKTLTPTNNQSMFSTSTNGRIDSNPLIQELDTVECDRQFQNVPQPMQQSSLTGSNRNHSPKTVGSYQSVPKMVCQEECTSKNLYSSFSNESEYLSHSPSGHNQVQYCSNTPIESSTERTTPHTLYRYRHQTPIEQPEYSVISKPQCMSNDVNDIMEKNCQAEFIPASQFTLVDFKPHPARDFQTNLVAATRHLLNQATLPPKGSVFPRSTPIGLAHPVRKNSTVDSGGSNQVNFSSEDVRLRINNENHLTGPQHYDNHIGPMYSIGEGYKGDMFKRSCTGQCSWSDFRKGQDIHHQDIDQHVPQNAGYTDPLHIHREKEHASNISYKNMKMNDKIGYMKWKGFQRGGTELEVDHPVRKNKEQLKGKPLYGYKSPAIELQNDTDISTVEKWPGYDSPPMDIDYPEYCNIDKVQSPALPIDQSFARNEKKSVKRLTYQAVPHTKQSKLVFR